MNSPKRSFSKELFPTNEQLSKTDKILLRYVNTWEIYNINKIAFDNIVLFKVVIDIFKSNDEIEPQNTEEC